MSDIKELTEIRTLLRLHGFLAGPRRTADMVAEAMAEIERLRTIERRSGGSKMNDTPMTEPAFKMTPIPVTQATLGITTAEVERRANAVAKFLWEKTSMTTSDCIAVGQIVRGFDPPSVTVNITMQGNGTRTADELMELAATFIEPKQTLEEAEQENDLHPRGRVRWNTLTWAAQALRKAFK